MPGSDCLVPPESGHLLFSFDFCRSLLFSCAEDDSSSLAFVICCWCSEDFGFQNAAFATGSGYWSTNRLAMSGVLRLCLTLFGADSTAFLFSNPLTGRSCHGSGVSSSASSAIGTSRWTWSVSSFDFHIPSAELCIDHLA